MSNFRRRLMMLQDKEEIIMTKESNPKVLAILYNNKMCASSNKITKTEAEAVTSFGTIFRSSDITHFKEMKYFTNVTTIEDYAFRACNSLSSVDLSNVTTIGSYGFDSCISLASVGDLSNITTIGNNAFMACNFLTSITDLSNVTTIGMYAFFSCNSLISIGGLSNIKNIGNYVFEYCPKLQSITILTDNAPTLGEGVFGAKTDNYTGKNVTTTKTLNIKQGATGYDTGDWVEVLLNPDKCNFTLNQINNR